jgi:predicted dehydrogenase
VLAECLEIERLAKEKGRLALVCHVLRYTPFFSTLKELLERETVGKIVTIRHEENIGNFHMAHSFVRGNWANAEKSSPIILQKSCHDFDILVWLAASRAESVSSVGSLTYFKEEKAPQGSAARCAECKYAAECRFSTEKCYLPILGDWPATVVSPVQTPEALGEALRTGPYGRCVYRCGNDVCDHQTSLITFENGVTASFTMSAFTNRMYREIRILCEDGEIWGNDEEGKITVTRFASNLHDAYREEVIHTARPQSGHGGGDSALVDDFFNALNGREAKGATSIDQSIESHAMAWAAEKSRLAGGERVPLAELREHPAKAGEGKP